MPVLRSKINTKTDTFVANAQHMQAQVNDLVAKIEQVSMGAVRKLPSAIKREVNCFPGNVLML